jgi:PAS domain S-box-containing protein
LRPEARLKGLSRDKLLARYVRLRSAFAHKVSEHRLSQKDLFQLLDNIRIGVAIIDLKGQVIFFNCQAERMSGYKRENVLDTHFRGFLALDDIDEGFKLFYSATHGHYPETIRLRLRKKDRSTLVAEVEAGPFYASGRLRGAIGFFHDLSERRKLEEVNRKRVEAFIRFSKEIDDWHEKVTTLKREVNHLLASQGKKEKYPLTD